MTLSPSSYFLVFSIYKGWPTKRAKTAGKRTMGRASCFSWGLGAPSSQARFHDMPVTPEPARPLRGEIKLAFVASGLGLRGAAGGLDDGESACTRLGTSPSGTGFPSPLDSGFRRSDELRGRNDQAMPRVTNERLLERAIPVRSPGDAFIAIAHAGWRRHTKV